jgi:mRNA interferase MazF
MSVRRGDVVLAWYPFASGQGGKRRPCVIAQNDEDNQKIANTIVAQVTSNLARLGDKSHFLIDTATADGQQTGLLHDSLVSCNNLAGIEQSLVQKTVGTLSAALRQQLDGCLKAALELP